MLQVEGEIQWRLSAELDDNAGRLFFTNNMENVLQSEWLEVKAVRCVIIGGDGFRIAIDHDRLIALFLQCERCVAAAVIELNSLPDTIRAAPQNNDLLATARFGLVLVFVRGIKVRRVRLKF